MCLDKNVRTHLVTFLLSFLTFLFYFKATFLHLNDRLTSLEGDAIKNYYTFLFHTVNDASIFHFNGMNYPFGEIPPFTDCQPILSAILHYLPFLHPYLVGIMHGILLLSFIITPNILLKIFKEFGVDQFTAVLSSLAIGLLSPQLHRIDSHFALAYGCVVPLAILFNLMYIKQSTLRNLFFLSAYNSILFFLHPYLGFGASLFTLIVQFTVGVHKTIISKPKWKEITAIFVAGLVPIIVFVLLMRLLDHRMDRPTEPYGIDVTMAKPSSIFVPIYGPFQHFMKLIIKTEFRHWEGFAYVGIFVNFLILFYLLNVLFLFRKLKYQSQLFPLMVGALLMLLFSFGVQNDIMQWLNIEIQVLRQFRALGRFSWYFYFVTPVILIVSTHHFFQNYYGKRVGKVLTRVFPIFFFFFNHLEGYDLLKPRANFLTQKNLFSNTVIDDNWKSLFNKVKIAPVKAILPIPQFFIGSEMYERNGVDSVYKTFVLSYHTGLPILSSMMSRTSWSETIIGIERINPGWSRTEDKGIQYGPYLVVQMDAPLKPSEESIINESKPFCNSTRIKMATLNADELNHIDERVDLLIKKNRFEQSNVYFVSDSSIAPFNTSKNSDYGMLVVIDSIHFKPGRYVLSFEYFFTGSKFANIDCNVVTEKTKNKVQEWIDIKPIRQLTALYQNALMYDQFVNIEAGCSYKIFLKGNNDCTYCVRNVLFRPDTLKVLVEGTETNLKWRNGFRLMN